MAATAKFGLPIPVLSDLPSGPLAVGNLANAIDVLGVVGGKRQTSTGSAVSTVETVVIDTQTLALPANSVFLIDFDLSFTAAVAANDLSMRIRLTNVTGTILGERAAIGTYVAPENNLGRLRVVYKTTAAELDYFVGSIIRIGAGASTVTAVVPTSLIVTNLGPSSIIGDY